MNEIISYKMCAVKVRNAKLRNYLKASIAQGHIMPSGVFLIVVYDRRLCTKILASEFRIK